MSLVSVLLPTFNRPAWVGNSIASVLQQDCDLELLILDNGSEDSTRKVLDLSIDPRIRRFRNEVNIGGDKGSPHAGLFKEAKGDYLVCFTDDDEMIPGTLKRKVKVLDENPGIGFVYTSAAAMNEHGHLRGRRRFGWAFDQDTIGGAAKDLIVKNDVTMPSCLFRKSLASADTPVEELTYSVWGDWFSWLAMAEVSDAAYLNHDSVIIRLHEDSDSHRRGVVGGGFLSLQFKIWDYWLQRGKKVTPCQWVKMEQTYFMTLQSICGDAQKVLMDGMLKFYKFKEQYV